MTSPYGRLLLLAALFAVFIRPTPGRAEAAAASARTVEGVATTQSGKPLPHATLYLFGLPPGQGQTDSLTLGDQTTVVTDDRGHFVWTPPAAWPFFDLYVGSRSIPCYALAADLSAVQYRLALRPNQHGTDAEQGTRFLLERETRPGETKWLPGETKSVFSVVVPDTSEVVLTVRGPDGQPLRAQEVQVIPAAAPTVYGGDLVYTGRTDAEGRLRLRFFFGSLSLQVFVPGVGFGSTGTFDAGPGQSAAPELPPLAPFARISGTVDAALLGPGASIHQDYFITDGPEWYDPRAAVDAQGRFTLDGVLPGSHRLLLAGGRGESEPVTVTIQPGEQIGGIVIGHKKAAPAPVPAPVQPAGTPSVRGHVTDAEGRPAAGVDVYAICPYNSGIRGYQEVLTARTDASGDYAISNIPGGNQPFGTSIHLVAHQPGFPLAFGDPASETDGKRDPWKDQQVNLVIPARHSSLTIRVLQDGKPLPNVPVALEPQERNWLANEFYVGGPPGEAAKALRKLLTPSAQTDAEGTSWFTDLTPGLWDVTVNRTSLMFQIMNKAISPINVTKNVAIQAGKDQSYTLSLLPPPAEIAFQFIGPNGLPLKAVPASMSVTTPRSPNYGNLTLVPDGTGDGRTTFGEPGLFQMTGQVSGGPLDINALVGPYFEGTSLVAVSAATVYSQPIAVAARRVGPASIRVHLADAQGKPLRGAVTIGNPFGSALYAASVDALGVVVFPNIPLNFFPYTVTAHITARPERVVPSRENRPLPSDAALIAGTGQPLPQSVRVRGGEETVVTFGAELPGYVRLRLTGPFASATGYYIEGRQSNDDPFTQVQFDLASGEYLLGPLPAGRRTFHLYQNVLPPVDANLPAGEVTATVKAGQVVSGTLAAQSTAAQELLHSAPLSGTVYLADGKTPAWGARAALFLPGRLPPERMARTDAQGRLTLEDYWRSTQWPWKAMPGNSTEPVLAAWLPGSNGAVIVPYHPGQEAHLVLPAAVALHGRVTVGVKTVLGLPSSFRIQAAYQGRGNLNQVLNVETTAQADGTFELAGLTPGTYQVQAARDNIWLSRTQTVTVGSGALSALLLDIAPPGAPLILHLEDGQGKPLPRREVRIARPAGPLTDEIWPVHMTTDDAGDLRVDGLEAGTHRLVEENAAFGVSLWTPNIPLTTRRIVLRHTP